MNFPLSITLLIIAIALLLIYIILYWAGYVAIPPKPSLTDNGNADLDNKNAPSSVGDKHNSLPGISVVIVTHDSDRMLERAISAVAAQDYPDFEIVIVNNASSDNTNNVIKRFAQQYPNLLRYTYLPQNKNGFLHEAMAVTLGVRAARKEWIMLLKPTSVPKSNKWLRTFAASISMGYDICLGYNHFYGYDNARWVRKAIRRLRHNQILNYRAIMRGKRKPIEAEGSNLAFRKEDFLSNGGYGKWLSLKSCHQNLYVTSYSKQGASKMLTSPQAQVETLLPPIISLWQTEESLRKRAYRRFPLETRLRRSHYTIIGLIALISAVCLIVGLVFSLMPLQVDNSGDLINAELYLNDYIVLPIYAVAGLGGYLLCAAVHFIVRKRINRRDIKRLRAPMISDPKEDFSDDVME